MSDNRADLEKLIQIINDGEIEKLRTEEFEQFQYQGFDPMKIVNSLLKVKREKEVGDDDFMKDVSTMVAVGMIKGSVNDHNMTKMSDAGKTDLNNLMIKYGIIKGGGKGQSSSLITFPRVMATFPDVCVRLVPIIGPKEFRGGIMNSSYLPDFMQVQVFPAIIPRKCNPNLKKVLLTASLCYSIDQTIQISRIQDPNAKTIAQLQGRFIDVGHTSPVPFEEIRTRVFNSLGIQKHYQSISIVIETYRTLVDPLYPMLTEATFNSMFT